MTRSSGLLARKPFGLTARQLEIAQLVVEGKTNLEIAAALVVSVRTVDAHVAAVYTKLDVHSRVELARRLLLTTSGGNDRDASASHATNLPHRHTTLYGRASEQTELHGLLERERLITVAGPAGVGKTTLALQAATDLLSEFPDGVWLVELAKIESGSELVPAVGAALGTGELRTKADLTGAIGEKRLLLVLDNCEHVIEEAARVVGQLLDACSGVHVLATSREPLKIAGERLYRLDVLDEHSAAALFVDRVRAVDRRFERSAANGELVAHICRRLDGLPLAIEFAAARANVFPLAEIADRLDDRLTLLSSGERTVDERHRTLRALIGWSYALLSAAEQRLFVRMGIFAGSATLEAIAAVDARSTAEVTPLLSSLVEKSLVCADLDRPVPRFGLLESTREYARERLAERGEELDVARAHAVAYVGVAETLDREWSAGADAAWLTRAEPELPNLRAALRWTLGAASDVALGQRLAGVMRVVWMNFAYAEGRDWVRIARSLIAEHTPAGVIGALEFAEAQLASALSEPSDGLAASLRAAKAFAADGDALSVARAEQFAGRLLVRVGRVDEASPLLERALDVAATSGNALFRATVIESLAYARSAAGDVAGARAFLSDALDAYTTAGARRSVAIVESSLAEAEFRSGDPLTALRYAESALAHSRGGHFECQFALNAAAYLIALDRFDEAWSSTTQVLELARHLKDHHLSWTIQHLAAVLALRPQPDVPRAAALIGFVDARLRASTGARQYTEECEYRRVLAVLETSAPEDELRHALLHGATFTDDEAISIALGDGQTALRG